MAIRRDQEKGSRKGATLSDKSARQEFGLTQQEITALEGIIAQRLACASAARGTPAEALSNAGEE